MYRAVKQDKIYQIHERCAEKYRDMGFTITDEAGKVIFEPTKAAPKKPRKSKTANRR